MNEAYKSYLVEMWKEAENIAVKCGYADIKATIAIFDKIAQPFYYWNK